MVIEATPTLGPDYYLAWDALTGAEHDVRLRTRRFVEEEVLPTINGFWERAEFPWQLARRLGELGLFGAGDGAAHSPLGRGVAMMELARGDASLATFFGVQGGLATDSIGLLGSDEQRQRWLPRLASVEAIGAFALSEPTHGSDSVALETTARRAGDAYVLDGAKRWIGNGSIADVIVVYARAEDGEVNGFLVERGTGGLDAQVIEGKGSLRAIWQAAIRLDGVRVPLESRLPGCESFRDVAHVLAGTRVDTAWAALGQATAAYETALGYASERRQFGRTLSSFQIVQERLVRMLAELTAMQLLCLRTAQLQADGRLTGPMASLAKLNNTRRARHLIAEARDVLGGNGILLDNHVMRHHADIESLHTYEGTETMQTLIVGRDITGVSAFV